MGQDYIREYLTTHSIYSKISFGNSLCNSESMLPPTLQASQAIIDKYIAQGKIE